MSEPKEREWLVRGVQASLVEIAEDQTRVAFAKMVLEKTLGNWRRT